MQRIAVLVIVGLLVMAATGSAVASVLHAIGLVIVPAAIAIGLLRLVWHYTNRW